MKYGERLNKARLYAGLTQLGLIEKLAELNCTLSQQGISFLENSDVLGCEFTVQIADICGVSVRWLAMEKGEMIQECYEVRDQETVYVVKTIEIMEKEAREELIRHIDFFARMSNKHSVELSKPAQLALPAPEPAPAPNRPASAVSGGPPNTNKKSHVHKKTA